MNGFLAGRSLDLMSGKHINTADQTVNLFSNIQRFGKIIINRDTAHVGAALPVGLQAVRLSVAGNNGIGAGQNLRGGAIILRQPDLLRR